MRHLPLFVFLAFLAAVACRTATTTTTTSTGGSAAAASDDSDCNLSTPLQPGVPGSPGNLVKSPRNPNGDSELALMMRMFVDDLQKARALAEAGEPIEKLYPRHKRMRCAWPTKPEERNAGFDGRAQGYLAAVRAFDDAPGKATYNAIVANCIACHNVSCGGVLEFIGSMQWQ